MRLSDPVILGLFGCLAAALFVWAGSFFEIHPDVLLRDPPSVFGYPFYAGVVSYIGIAALVVSAAVTRFAAHFSEGDTAGLLHTAFLLNAALALDDLFQVHEVAGPRYLGLSEFGVFVILAAGFAYLTYRVLRYRPALPLAGYFFSLALLGGSVFVDQTGLFTTIRHWFEDTLKLGGLTAWTAFWIGVSAGAMGKRI